MKTRPCPQIIANIYRHLKFVKLHKNIELPTENSRNRRSRSTGKSIEGLGRGPRSARFRESEPAEALGWVKTSIDRARVRGSSRGRQQFAAPPNAEAGRGVPQSLALRERMVQNRACRSRPKPANRRANPAQGGRAGRWEIGSLQRSSLIAQCRDYFAWARRASSRQVMSLIFC
jgi:hypothetical protein